MIKFLKSKALLAFGAVSALIFGLVNTCRAAADVDLVAAAASTSAIFADNKGTVINMVVVVITAVLIFSLAVAIMLWAQYQAVGSIGGRGRRRR